MKNTPNYEKLWKTRKMEEGSMSNDRKHYKLEAEVLWTVTWENVEQKGGQHAGYPSWESKKGKKKFPKKQEGTYCIKLPARDDMIDAKTYDPMAWNKLYMVLDVYT